MVQIPFKQAIAKIVAESGLPEEQILDKIKAKKDLLSGLISDDGAAQIIANEMGVKLLAVGGLFKIRDIQTGSRNVDVQGRVTHVFEVREFNTGSRSGKVGNFMISDETGSIRITLWNDMTDKMSDIKVGDIVHIKNSYARQNNQGMRELHLNDNSAIVMNPEGIEIAERQDVKKKIVDLAETDDRITLLGTIVDIYRPAFFEVCPECGKRAHPQEGKPRCAVHGEVEETWSYVVNVLLDDGSGTVRIAHFRQQADALFENTLAMKDDLDLFETKKSQVLGSMLRVGGRVTKNSLNGNLELTAQNVTLNPTLDAEIKKLEEEINNP